MRILIIGGTGFIGHQVTRQLASAIALVATTDEAAKRIYNVGEPDALTEGDWLALLSEVTAWAGEIKVVDDEALPAHLVEPFDWQHHLYADTGQIRRELGFSERVSRKEALRRTVEWERANPPAEIKAQQFDYRAEDSGFVAKP